MWLWLSDVEAPLLKADASLQPPNGDGGANDGRRVDSTLPSAAGAADASNNNNNNGDSKQEQQGQGQEGGEQKEKEKKSSGSRKRERSVLQAKLTKLSIMIGKVGMAAAVLTVIALFVRFVLDHFVLPERPSSWDWVYLQFFIKYIVIGTRLSSSPLYLYLYLLCYSLLERLDQCVLVLQAPCSPFRMLILDFVFDLVSFVCEYNH